MLAVRVRVLLLRMGGGALISRHLQREEQRAAPSSSEVANAAQATSRSSPSDLRGVLGGPSVSVLPRC